MASTCPRRAHEEGVGARDVTACVTSKVREAGHRERDAVALVAQTQPRVAFALGQRPRVVPDGRAARCGGSDGSSRGRSREAWHRIPIDDVTLLLVRVRRRSFLDDASLSHGRQVLAAVSATRFSRLRHELHGRRQTLVQQQLLLAHRPVNITRRSTDDVAHLQRH